MSEVAEQYQVKANQAVIIGQCVKVTRFSKVFIHLVRLPKTDDPYGFPDTVEVAAERPLVKAGEPFLHICDVHSFNKSGMRTNPDTGDQEKTLYVNIKLRAVE